MCANNKYLYTTNTYQIPQTLLNYQQSYIPKASIQSRLFLSTLRVHRKVTTENRVVVCSLLYVPMVPLYISGIGSKIPNFRKVLASRVNKNISQHNPAGIMYN